MYVDVKVTVWQRIKLNEDESVSTGEMIENLKRHEPYMGFLWDDERLNPSWESIVETEEYMTVEDNLGSSTVELYNDDDELLWENSKTEGNES